MQSALPWTYLFYSSLSWHWTCCYRASCAVLDESVIQQSVHLCCLGRVCYRAICAALDEAVLQQSVLPWTSLLQSNLCCPGRVCYTAICAAFDESVIQQSVLPRTSLLWSNLCCPGRVCYRAICAALDVSVLQQPVLSLNSMCTAVLIGWDAAPPLLYPHLGSYTRAQLVSQDRRHLFVTPFSYT